MTAIPESPKVHRTFEAEVKESFIKKPAQMRLLIVFDKLLTGFDAPSATYLYIDKSMKDHGLFQAICRVNRLDGDDKEYGGVAVGHFPQPSRDSSMWSNNSCASPGFRLP